MTTRQAIAKQRFLEETKRVMLVYQAGIANVFEVSSFNLADYGRDAKRVYQGDFYGAVMLCKGLAMAGKIIRTAHCNKAGDIANAKWSEDFNNAPFSDKLTILKYN